MPRYSVVDSDGTEVKLRSPTVVSILRILHRWFEIIGQAHSEWLR